MKFSTVLAPLLLPFVAFGQQNWMLGPFEKLQAINPILRPTSQSTFFCPMVGRQVRWENNHVFNPAAVVKDGKICLFYRAEDSTGIGIGGHVSRIGLAQSIDGQQFTRQSEPIFHPADDSAKTFEWTGGCEDPRIVQTSDGRFVMTYTAWNRKVARLCVAISNDLKTWEKHGPAFAEAHDGRFKNLWSKSGSIVCKKKGDRLVAAKIRGKFWMFFGDTNLFLATSTDLKNWEPVLAANGELLQVMQPRSGKFDSELVEPGPPALLTKHGIVLIYNSKNSETVGDKSLPPGIYTAGQALFSKKKPAKMLDRTAEPFFKPETDRERQGQYQAGTTFLEGLVFFRGKWWLYYGESDSRISVAVFEP